MESLHSGKIMSDLEFYEEIYEYIQEREVKIDGEWGTGNTWEELERGYEEWELLNELKRRILMEKRNGRTSRTT